MRDTCAVIYTATLHRSGRGANNLSTQRKYSPGTTGRYAGCSVVVRRGFRGLVPKGGEGAHGARMRKPSLPVGRRHGWSRRVSDRNDDDGSTTTHPTLPHCAAPLAWGSRNRDVGLSRPPLFEVFPAKVDAHPGSWAPGMTIFLLPYSKRGVLFSSSPERGAWLTFRLCVSPGPLGSTASLVCPTSGGGRGRDGCCA